MKLAVFYPWSSPFVFTGFADSIANLIRPEGYKTRFFRAEGWCPSRRHNDGCEKALAWGADLILCIGADQIYPEDMLVKLVNRFEETRGGVITALVPFRGYIGWQEMKPFQPIGWRLECEGVRPFRGSQNDPDMMIPINPADGDLQRVNLIGSGVLMFHRDHLLALKRPWFYDRVDRETMHRIADMDSHFVVRLQIEAGAQVYVDTTINVKHLHIFPIDETYPERFADWKQGKGDPEIIKYRLAKPEDVPGALGWTAGGEL